MACAEHHIQRRQGKRHERLSDQDQYHRAEGGFYPLVRFIRASWGNRAELIQTESAARVRRKAMK